MKDVMYLYTNIVTLYRSSMLDTLPTGKYRMSSLGLLR